MVTVGYARASVLSEKEQDDIINAVIRGKKDMNTAAAELGLSPEAFKKIIDTATKTYGGSGGYGNDIQKVISYKGTVREMMLTASNGRGGKYPLKVVNIYIKPNTERYYDESIYSVDKDAIRKGTPSEGYNPDKALWSKTNQDRIKVKTDSNTPTPSKPSTLPDTIELRRKRVKKAKAKIKVVKHAKRIKPRLRK